MFEWLDYAMKEGLDVGGFWRDTPLLVEGGIRGKAMHMDLETIGHDRAMFHDVRLCFDSPPCESYSRPGITAKRKLLDSLQRRYDVPPAVERGFAAYLGIEPTPAPSAPEPFHLDVSRYSSRCGRAMDLPAMLHDLDAATRAGRTIVVPCETSAR